MIDADSTSHVELALDPFAYIPDLTSSVAGLHGSEPLTDSTYVFHTLYIDSLAGLVVADIRFTDLVSRNDRLVLTVHSLDRMTERLAVVTKMDVSLRTIAASGGRIRIEFEASSEYAYAILGRTLSSCQARATQLEIACRSYPDRKPVRTIEAGASRFEAATMRSATALLCNRPPRLSAPVCQAATRDQFAEPDYRRLAAEAGLAGVGDRREWEILFILQCLHLYGIVSGHGRGLGFGPEAPTLVPVLQAAGCTSVMASTLAQPGGKDAATGQAEASSYLGLIALPPAEEIGSYDFLWSHGLSAILPSPADLTFLIEDSLAYLRPGGIAIHILSSSLGIDGAPIDLESASFDRNDLGRLSLAIVAGRNEIAQMNMFTDENDQGLKSYGIMVRRG